MNLAEILHPVPAGVFLVEHFNQKPLHVSGPPDKFAGFDSAGSGTSVPDLVAGARSAAERIARNLERELEAPVRAEYAAHQDTGEPQRGEADLFILQTAGETAWEFYRDESSAAVRIVLQPGGVLYLPRAWWRTARPGSAASAACTFHIQNPTGAEFLVWLARKAKELPAFQTDLPRFASPAVQAEYLARLRQAFGAVFRTANALEMFRARLNRLAPAHRAPAGSQSAGGADGIALAAPRVPRIHRRDSETIFIVVENRQILFPIDAAQLLQYLCDKAPFAAAEFYRQFESEFDQEDLSIFLDTLWHEGVIEITGANRE